MKNAYLPVYLFAIILSEIGGCSFSISSPAATASQYAGSYVFLAQNCYTGAFGVNSFFPLFDGDAAKQPNGQAFFQSQLASLVSAWQIKAFVDDDFVDIAQHQNCDAPTGRNVQNSDFTSSSALHSDFLWYTGHGGGGEVALFDSAPSVLGPGYSPNGSQYSFGPDYPNLQSTWAFGAPIMTVPPPPGAGAGLKWVFLNSSQSVKLGDSSNFTWASAFNQSQNGIHGIYGFEGEPTANGPDQTLVNNFLSNAVTVPAGAANPMNIRTSWIDAAMSASEDVYGIWELQNSGYDVLSGPTMSGSPPYALESEYSSNDALNFYDPSGSVVLPVLSSLSSQSIGTYTEMNLEPESYNDSSLSSMSDQYSTAISKTMRTSNQYRISTYAYVGSHFEASGGVMMSMPLSNVIYNGTESAAQSFATSTLQNSAGGLPSDAKLMEMITHRSTSSGKTSVLGYSFIWKHSNNTLGGDKIIVTVDNAKVVSCASGHTVNPPAPGKPYFVCDTYQTTYPNRASFVYRLWRTQDSKPVKTRFVYDGSAEPSSTTLYNEAMTDPQVKGNANLGNFLGYAAGYYTPDINSTDNTAYPAIHFYYSTGLVVTADAYTGKVDQISQ